ncbi:hypothetical protein HPP92_017862 [Vanilla planifolia]|uniref:Uncharacterized protein n=1 Tax=Vanilla planifolia TaxID=51239 RepID=A0A835UMB8_VANPL|nr:hypothetical protein HPP92_017862 [Vanilla planifolia]
MARTALSLFKSPQSILSCRSFCPSDANSSPSLSFLCLPSRVQPVSLRSFRCASIYGDYQHERSLHARPSEIPWSKDLANSVQLIGTIGTAVQIKQLGSGKVVAWTRLGFKKSLSDISWIGLTFWEELAHVAFQHLEKGNQVYVSGRLVCDTTEGDNEHRQIFFKVVVQQLNFIERNFPTVSLYEQGSEAMSSGLKNGRCAGSSLGSASAEELWQAFFANPLDWWDNRKNKRHSKYPDFKHKHTGEALWVDGKKNPSWVKSQLAILDEKMVSFQAHGSNSTDSLLKVNELTSF